jgi:hypothetical protein
MTVIKLPTREEIKLEEEINKRPSYTNPAPEPSRLLKHYHTPFKPKSAFNPRLSTPRKNKL